ncbi:Alpha amylase, catalytic domain family protein [Aspergillus niger]|uniref:Alpha amylase, catalytic domain family protein n=1 Tax=Aspergillus niger TaxID=5061 RepID=A0A505HUG4_ASPNG|nr:Alpha amylase, catalytic domain family protein [Aspergillus niger]
MPPQRVPQSPFPRHRSKRIACKQCRQSKLRCEVSTGGAIPCSRCRRLGYDCRLDAAYQRVNGRERLEELEKEVQHLRSSVSTHPPAAAPQSLQGILLTPSESYHADASSIVGQESSGSRVDLVASQVPSFFFTHYHPYVPLLDPTISPDQYYARSAVLFWSIILLASRRYTEEPGLFVSLTAPVKKLIWDTIANPPHTWHVVQAIILVCLWPFPTSSLSSDITSILLSTAQTISLRIGLHRPEAIQDFSRTKRRLMPDEMAEVARTWATCYITAQTIVTIDGQVWVSSDWMIDRLCDRDSTMIPMSLKHQLLLSRFSARVGQFMSSHSQGPTDLPRPGEFISLLALLEREYTELASSLTSYISEENKVLLNGIGLQLYVFYLLEESDSDTRKRGLLRAYSIAISTITIINQLEALTDAMAYGPVSYFRIISIAAMFIMKLSYSNLGPFVDLETGKRSFNSAIALTRRTSIEDNDLPGRMSKILTQLWSAQVVHRGQRDKPPGLRLKTRLAASLVHDSIWMWREQFGGQPRSGTNTPLASRGYFADNRAMEQQRGGLSARGTGSAGQEAATSFPVGIEDACPDGLTLEDVVDAELLALLPFSLDGEIFTAPGGC